MGWHTRDVAEWTSLSVEAHVFIHYIHSFYYYKKKSYEGEGRNERSKMETLSQPTIWLSTQWSQDLKRKLHIWQKSLPWHSGNKEVWCIGELVEVGESPTWTPRERRFGQTTTKSSDYLHRLLVDPKTMDPLVPHACKFNLGFHLLAAFDPIIHPRDCLVCTQLLRSSAI